MTTWTQEGNIRSDFGQLLVNVGDDTLCDNSGNIILFHNGDFYDSDTDWTEN